MGIRWGWASTGGIGLFRAYSQNLLPKRKSLPRPIRGAPRSVDLVTAINEAKKHIATLEIYSSEVDD